jgi:hypothetical protein
MIELQFKRIQAFFVSLHINLQTKDMPKGLESVIAQVMVCILRVLGVATRYSKENKITRGWIIK